MARLRLPLSARGFTLVEVLVALLILSVLAATAWKGMDAIGRSRELADNKLKETLRLQSVMTQWEADMAQVLDTQVVPGLEFDGAALRLTRKSQTGVVVVTWAARQGRWLRWASPVVSRVGELRTQWQRSYALQGREAGTLTALQGVVQWQVYCFRGGAMSNCQSSGDLAPSGAGRKTSSNPGAPGARVMLPEAVRLSITLDERSGLPGTVLRDVMLAPQPN